MSTIDTDLPACPTCEGVTSRAGSACGDCYEDNRYGVTTRCARCGAQKAADVLPVCGQCPAGYHPFDQPGAYTYEFLGGEMRSLHVAGLWCPQCGRVGLQDLLFGVRGVAAVVYRCGHWQPVTDWTEEG
jgi:hypothetical protein